MGSEECVRCSCFTEVIFPLVELSSAAFQVEQKDISPDNCEKNLDKCITAYNNYQETHSGNKQGQMFTPKDLRCMNWDRLNNPLFLSSINDPGCMGTKALSKKLGHSHQLLNHCPSSP